VAAGVEVRKRPESGVVKRMYLHEEAGDGEGSMHAAALVRQSALYLQHGMQQQQGGGPVLANPVAVEEEEQVGERWRT
jgi:hypothetical protein